MSVRQRSRLVLSFSLVLAATWLARARSIGAGTLSLHVLDVGQGLAVYVEGPTGDNLLIDGGNDGQGAAIVVPYLTALGVPALKYGLMTHWHPDHFGGLDEVYDGGFRPTVSAFDRGSVDAPGGFEVTQYLNAVAGIRAIPTIGQVLDLGGGATATIVSINGAYPGGSVPLDGRNQQENGRSIGVHVEYGDFDFFCAGDLTGGGSDTANVEDPTALAVGQVEVAVSSHHGSVTSSKAVTVAALAPSVVLHSAGLDNGFGHPANAAVKAFSMPAATRVQWCSTNGDTTGIDNGSFVVADETMRIDTDGVDFTLMRATSGETTRFATFERSVGSFAVDELAVGEVLVDPAGSADAYGEWFELVSLAPAERDLGGLELVSGIQSFRIASRILVEPGERVLIANDGRSSRNGNVFPAICGPWQSWGLPNGADSLSVRTADGALVETVAWGARDASLSIEAGISDERINLLAAPVAANFSNAQTAWDGADLGTPGAPGALEIDPCPTPVAYGTGKPSSIGSVPVLGWSGTPDLAIDDFAITLAGAVPRKPAVGFWGTGAAQIPFFGHTLFVQPPLARLPIQRIDPQGQLTYAVPIDASMVETTRYYQVWYRDPAHPDGTAVGLSSAVQVTFCPVGARGGPAMPGDVIVSELMKDPTFVSDADGEWIELTNTTPFPMDIEGFTLRDDDGEAHGLDAGGAGLVVPAQGRLVLASNQNPLFNGFVAADYGWSGFVLDPQDEIVLEGPSGLEIDRVVYDDSKWPTTPGRSLQLSPDLLDAGANDLPASWCHGTTAIVAGNPDTGTPGAPNDPCP